MDGWYVTSSVSIEHPAMPPQSKYVRGEQGPNVIRLRDIESGTKMEWLLITNLKVRELETIHTTIDLPYNKPTILIVNSTSECENVYRL